MKLLPLNFRQHPAPKDIKTLDSIMIMARSSGILYAGQYSEEIKPPQIKLNIYSTNNTRVESEEVSIGSKDMYTLTFKINNGNDSPTFANLEIL